MISLPRITIIGGGPAGSIAAVCLARHGWNVTLIEQHRFPREKVCGDCVSALGIEVLQRQNLAAGVAARKPARLTRADFHAPCGESVSLNLPQPMWGISRAALDDELLGAARSAGAVIRQPARCEAIVPEVLVRDLESNEIHALASDFVIVADGKAALAANRPHPTADLGASARFAGVDGPAEAIQLYGVAGHYGGAAPIEGGDFNVAFSIPAGRVATRGGDFDAIFADLLSENRSLRGQFASAHRRGEWLASPLPRFGVIESWPPHVIPVGNAAAALEPIGGEGMGLAMRSAELAADAVCRSVVTHARFDWPALKRQYDRLWRTRSWVCRAGARIMSSPRMASWSVELVRSSPPLADLLLMLAGKQAARAGTVRHQIP